jgi:Zn-dependent peptidase ImmA (M78 family)
MKRESQKRESRVERARKALMRGFDDAIDLLVAEARQGHETAAEAVQALVRRQRRGVLVRCRNLQRASERDSASCLRQLALLDAVDRPPKRLRAPSLIPAALLLDQLGIKRPEQIRIDAIAGHCGARIVEEPLEGCDARLVACGERAIITVNSAHLPTRRRFSAAHELGHWHLDAAATFDCAEGDSTLIERRADTFAAELLMPARMFRRRLHRQTATVRLVRSLAEEFQTSLIATARRLVELTEEAIVLVVARDGREDWSASPSAVRLTGMYSRSSRLLDETSMRCTSLLGGRRRIQHVDSTESTGFALSLVTLRPT